MKSLVLLVLASFVFTESSHAQAADSVEILSIREVIELARENHPIIKQARLQQGFAEAELRSAKGSFDPKLNSRFLSKNLKDTDYYSKFHNSLKIPTWFPLDPKVEVYRNEGAYLNPENYVSSSADYWQVTTGVSLPIGKGLFIDERRTLVKQARYFGDLAEAEQISLTNKILLTIIKTYWDWYLAYREYQLMQQSVAIAETLFDRVKLDYSFGEAAVIDTVQAKITYQSRKIDFQKASLAYTQAKLAMEIHLWGPHNTPLELTSNVIPTDREKISFVPSDSSVQELYTWARTHHPEVQKLEAKKNQMTVEQQWYRESLKPEINLSYSLINAPFARDGVEAPQWENNYKLGLDFSFPLFLRKERGKLQKNQLYIEQIDFDKVQLQQEIITSAQSTYAELTTNQVLVRAYESMAENYLRLLEAEIFNLENGESDLFKLNIQQDKYIEAQRKYLNALIKFEKLKASLPYTIGLPNLAYENLYE